MEVATISPRDLAGKRQNGEPVDQHVAGVLVVGEGDDAGGDLDEVRAEFTPIPNVEDLGQPVRDSHRVAAEEVVRLGDELHDAVLDAVVHLVLGAISLNVRSPLHAANATRALNSAVCTRGLLLIHTPFHDRDPNPQQGSSTRGPVSGVHCVP